MLFLQKRGGLLRLKMNILKQLAQLQQLSVALAIGFKLEVKKESKIILYYMIYICASYSLDVQHHPRPPRDARTSV